MQHTEGQRQKLERDVADDRAALRRALRDLALSLVIGFNLPRRIRRRPLPWAIGGLALAAVVVARRQRRKRAASSRRWWERGAQA
ncbi:MAG TPA: hypothetical protein VMR86_21155 [Myxococcota bacterium]|nr:hypothetical protein [Myxococcota bacterium]